MSNPRSKAPLPTRGRRRAKRPTPTHDQRDRIIWAAQRLVCEGGTGELTVGKVAAKAGIPAPIVRAGYAGPGELRIALFDHLTAGLRFKLRDAYLNAADGGDGVRSALQQLLGELDAHRRLARFLIVDSVSGDTDMLARRGQILGELANALATARSSSPQEDDPPHFGPEAIVNSLAAVLHGRLSTDPPAALSELSGSLMGFIMLLQLGSAATRRELQRTPTAKTPTIAAMFASEISEPLQVTYRSAAVLAAIGERPGMSNREIAAAAGVAHESQTSRLLSRLRRLGLIESASCVGIANAWRLTDTGSQVLAEIRWPPGEP